MIKMKIREHQKQDDIEKSIISLEEQYSCKGFLKSVEGIRKEKART